MFGFKETKVKEVIKKMNKEWKYKETVTMPADGRLFTLRSRMLRRANVPRQMDILSPVPEAKNEYTYSVDASKLKMVQKWNPNYSTTPSGRNLIKQSYNR